MQLQPLQIGQLNLVKQKIVFCILLFVISLWAERIVTLGPAVTNQILLLNSGDDIVGKTSYCDSTAGTPTEVKVVGSLLSLSLESIAALKPTVIFASGLTPEPLKKKLSTLGFEVVTVLDVSSYSALCDNLRLIAKTLNKTELADSILTVSFKKYEALQEDVEKLTPKKLFFELGGKPLYSVIKGSLGDELITLIGGENIFNLTISGEVSRESVLKHDPEVILISGMGEISVQEKVMWESFHSLSAVKNNSVHIVDAYAVGSPTPVSFLETIEEFRTLVHPPVTKND